MQDIDHGIFESVQFIDSFKKSLATVRELKDQWKIVADSFVKHKWIYRYIDDKQKETLESHYKVLTDREPLYQSYRKSFKYICKFMGLPADQVIIENLEFKKDKEDKNQWEISLRYSKGLAKVRIPDGVQLIHISPVQNITELIPTFRSKTKGKYMYPSKRVFFTIAKDIKKKQAGLEGKKIVRYTPKHNIATVYIDPTYSDFWSGAVYVDTQTPIPVTTIESKSLGFIKLEEAIQE